MKQFTFITIIVAILAIIAIGLKTTIAPLSFEAIGFIGWAITPYTYLAVMAYVVSGKTTSITVLILVLLTGGFGVWAFIDAMFIHTDAQGGLVYVVVPFWQWIFLLLASLPVYYLNKVKNA